MTPLTARRLRQVAKLLLLRKKLRNVELTDRKLDRLREAARQILGWDEEEEHRDLDYDPLVLSSRLWVPEWVVNDQNMWQKGKFGYLDPRDLVKDSEYEVINRVGTEWQTDQSGDTVQVAIEEVEIISSVKRTRGMLGFSRGNLPVLRKYFGHLEWRDRRAKPKLDLQLCFITDIKDKQLREDAVECRPEEFAYNGDKLIKPAVLRKEQHYQTRKMVKSEGGIMHADTGWGKTVSSIWCICDLGMVTLILTEEGTCARGWLEEFYRHTNISLLEAERDEDLIGIYGKMGKKGHFWPITIATYQSFIHNDILLKNRDRFGVVWVDEVDRAAAFCFSQVSNVMNPYYRGGCTATIERNDGLEGLVEDIIGPVSARGVEKTMTVDVRFFKTGINVPQYKGATWWTRSLTYLVGNAKYPGVESYMHMVRKLIHWLLMDGRNILLVSDRNDFLHRLRDELDPERHDDVPEGMDIRYWDDPDFILTMIGSSDRDTVVRKARSGKCRVVLGQAKLLRRAVNVECWDAGILATPMAGWSKSTRQLPIEKREVNPELYQLAGRLRRVLDGKRTPLLIDMVAGGTNYMIENTHKSRRGAYERMGFRVCQDIMPQTVDENLKPAKTKSRWF